MTALPAVAGRPRRQPAEAPRRHLEVAPTRAQRRARPRLLPALVTIGGIGVILLAQLLLSIVLADGAYQISGLQSAKHDAVLQQHALSEQLDLLASPQHLAANAEALGMVASGNAVYLDAKTGSVTGTGTAAGGSLLGAGDQVGNVLLAGVALVTPSPTGTTTTDSTGDTQAPTDTGTGGTGQAPQTPGLLPSPPPTDPSENTPVISLRMSKRRLSLTVIAVFAIVAVFVIRLVDIQLVQAAELTKLADAHGMQTVTTYGTRGNIVDSNGTVLADSVDRFDITASPQNVSPDGFDHLNKDGSKTKVSLTDAIGEIANLTGADPQTLYTALTKDPKSDFVYLVKAVKLDVFNKVKALDIPWVYSEPHPSRTYPDGAVAGNLVGFIGTDGPLAGTELKQNSCLAGTNGTSSYATSADGVRLPGSTVVTKPASDGGTIALTIDSNLQWFAQQTLDGQVQATGAQWGTAMVVRVSDGHIMADADSPSIDPNDLNSVDRNSTGARSFASPYEPGSIMKPATLAGMVDQGLVTAATQVDVPSRFTDGLPAGTYIKDSYAHGDVHMTAAGVIMNSSNIGVSELVKAQNDKEGLAASEKARYDNLVKFGFGTKTTAGFLGESSGEVKTPSQVDTVTSFTQQFGQGISATSAQIASMYQALGNDGKKVPLTLVDSCTSADGAVTHPTTGATTQVVSASAAQQVRQMMETVTTQGSLHNVINIPGYRIAAKSGTAQVAENGAYGSNYIVSVAGLIPADKPQYVVIVTLAEPQTNKTSAAAAPGYVTLMKQVIKTFRIQPSTTAPANIPVSW